MDSPWNFSDPTPPQTALPGFQLTYGQVGEIAMGAPLGGPAYLNGPAGQQWKINEFCGGPGIWAAEGNRIALPVWTPQRSQQIGVIDLQSLRFTRYQRIFRVLQLSEFAGNQISGIDSPIFQKKKFTFLINDESIDLTYDLQLLP